VLELRRLRVLREVARHGSLSSAAAALSYTPSAVSQQLSQLEREVGAKLVERRSTGVVLTRAGQVLVAHANAMLARASRAEEDLRQLADGSWGRLRVGAFASAAAALMPEAIVAMRAAEPSCAIELVEQDTPDSIAELRRGELDLAIIVPNCERPNDEPELEITPLLNDRIDILLPAEHRLAGNETVSLEDLRDDAWIDCSGSPVRFYLASRGIEPNVIFNSDQHYVIHALVASQVAVAFSPRLTQPVLEAALVVKPLAPTAPFRRVAIAVRTENRHAEAIASLIEILFRIALSRDGSGVVARETKSGPTEPIAASGR
jgi:DNA-binding transcriptional LysR family regulator